MERINYDVFRKNSKGKYEKVNSLQSDAIYIIRDLLNYYERKADGEKIKIIKHYNYSTNMNIDVFFNNEFKYSYYAIPCLSGAMIDSKKMLEKEV